jgi:hypothetical protein
MQPGIDYRCHACNCAGVLSEKLAQKSIKLLGALDEHKVFAPFVLFKNLQPGPGDVFLDPDLGLPRHQAPSPADNEGREG